MAWIERVCNVGAEACCVFWSCLWFLLFFFCRVGVWEHGIFLGRMYVIVFFVGSDCHTGSSCTKMHSTQ
jgi:hypothetical protein